MGCKVSIQVHPMPVSPNESEVKKKLPEKPTTPLMRANSLDSLTTVYLHE